MCFAVSNCDLGMVSRCARTPCILDSWSVDYMCIGAVYHKLERFILLKTMSVAYIHRCYYKIDYPLISSTRKAFKDITS